MKTTMRQIHYVLEVARLGSVSEASKHLSISQSSILAAIELAEWEFKAQIFNRQRPRGVIVTTAGERYLSAARNLIASELEFDQTLDQMIHGAPKKLRLGCFEPFGALFMPSVIRQYTEKSGPCEIMLHEGDHTQLREWLATGVVEMIVTYDMGADFGYDITPICKVPAHALLRTDDELSKQESVSISELSQKPLILLDLPETRTYLLTLFDIVATRPTISFRARSYDTIKGAVSAGFGVSVLNMRPFEKSCKDPEGLIRLPISDPLNHPTLIVADIYGNKKPSYIVKLIDTIDHYFKEIGPERYSFKGVDINDKNQKTKNQN